MPLDDESRRTVPSGEVDSHELLSLSQMQTRVIPRGEADSPPGDETPPRLEAGQMLGQYRLLERLGAGGMGEVFKAIHVTMDRVVALKVLVPHLIRDERARVRFQREVRNAARLSHPHIVMAHDAAEDNGVFFLVMEYVEGADLCHLVGQHGLPPMLTACEIIRQTALGLQHAHERSMVHRDIKPANLMLARPAPRDVRRLVALAEEANTWHTTFTWPTEPIVKVLDFGLARADPTETPIAGYTVTRENTVVGTPEFMSPEQTVDSRRVDIRSDIYSLGCTFYFLLVGRPPFSGDTMHEILTRHLKETPLPVHQRRGDLPPALSQVVQRMLAKLPRERFQTPAAVAEALAPWMPGARGTTPSSTLVLDISPSSSWDNAPAPAPSPPKPAPSRVQPLRRSLEDAPQLGWWLGLALLAAILSALLGWMVWRQAEPLEEKMSPLPRNTIPD